MRAVREPALAGTILLTGCALFFGGGVTDGPLPWLGAAALALILLLLTVVGLPGGLRLVAPFAAFAAWLALSITWSVLPDRSWDYADRTLVYLLFALLGLWLAGRTRQLALGLALVLGAVIAWSLLGKVLPPVYDYGGPDVTRLRGPIGLWNQLALACDFALPLALWRRRVEGTLLAYLALVALVLTYSRGGIVTAVVVLALWLAFGGERFESAGTLVAAAVPAAVVLGVAFALPGITANAQPLHVRWRDGLIFGALLLAGALAAAFLRRIPLPRPSPAVRRAALVAAALAVAAAVAVVAIKGAGSGSVGNGGGRLGSTSSNFRFTWWGQALHGFSHHRLAGTGAGSFQLTNLLYRRSYLDTTTEPHDLPLQFLSETGLIGLLLFALATAALLRGAVRRRGHELALGLLLPAFLVHSLVDIDWDFVAVSAPAFLAAGALAGRLPARRASPFAVLAAAGAALLAFGALLSPWLGHRWSGEALAELGGSNAKVISLARRARSVDPYLVEPLWWQASAQADPNRAWALYREAVRVQPHNPYTWLQAGLFAVGEGCPRAGYTYLEKFTELDPYDRPSVGADAYRRALALVNSGKPTC